jgi:hypothetical protein
VRRRSHPAARMSYHEQVVAVCSLWGDTDETPMELDEAKRLMLLRDLTADDERLVSGTSIAQSACRGP